MGGTPFPPDFTFRLTHGTTVGGFVLDESGEPIAGARVEVIADFRLPESIKGAAVVNHWLATEEDGCVTDAHGFWSLDNVPKGNDRSLNLWLSHPDFVADLNWRGSKDKSFPTLDQFRSQKAKVVMEKGVKVSGKITDTEGNPVPDAMVIWGHKPYYSSHHPETFSDKEGVYRLPPLSASSTILTVVAPGFAPQLTPITPAGLAMTRDFKLQRGKTTQIKFVDSTGKPVPKVGVGIAGWRGEETLFNSRHPNVPYSKIPDEADENGEWKWDWSPDDTVTLCFGKDGYKYDGKKLYFGPGEYQVTLREIRSP